MRKLLRYAIFCLVFSGIQLIFADEVSLTRPPKIFPDYIGVTIPPNIAPMNFLIQEDGTKFRARFSSPMSSGFLVENKGPDIRIPISKWRKLLEESRGTNIFIEIEAFSGQWLKFERITNFVAPEKIDSWIAYRYLKPLYNFYINMSIRQRCLETFEEKPILQNTSFNHGCLNCHTFLNYKTDKFAFHTRTSRKGNPMILCLSNEPVRVDRTAGYISWHPSGRLIAYSANKLSLFFHTVGETRDVFDAESNLGIYRVDSNTVVVPPALAQPEILETWPNWAPDGKYLYYCAAPKLPIKRYREVKYDLMRIPYDIETDKWGEPEKLVSAEAFNLSTHEPRVSPDSRFVLFCMSEYGNFPVYRPDSDIYIMDLQNRSIRRLELNSEKSDSWHCWSSNGRWILFSSKRIDGLFARPHISYFDSTLKSHKAFVLPQLDPSFYQTCFYTFNVPEFISEPVRIDENTLAKAIDGRLRVLKPRVVQEGPPREEQIHMEESAPETMYYQTQKQ
jgi:hypothetical protein